MCAQAWCLDMDTENRLWGRILKLKSDIWHKEKQNSKLGVWGVRMEAFAFWFILEGYPKFLILPMCYFVLNKSSCSSFDPTTNDQATPAFTNNPKLFNNSSLSVSWILPVCWSLLHKLLSKLAVLIDARKAQPLSQAQHPPFMLPQRDNLLWNLIWCWSFCFLGFEDV